MNNSNNDDDLFSGMALKDNKKKSTSKKEDSFRPNLPTNSNNFQLDFLNSLVSSGSHSNLNNNNTKYIFPNESLFSSLNNLDDTDGNLNNLARENIFNNKIKGKNQEYSFLNKRQASINSVADENQHKISKLKEFEESLKDTESLLSNSISVEKGQSLENENRFVKVYPSENGEFSLISLKEEYEKYICANEENLVKIYLRLVNLNNLNSQKQNYSQELELKLSELSTKENQAIEQNDFEEAQKLENCYNSTKNLIEECKKEIKINKKEINFLRDQEVFLMKNFLEINNSFRKWVESESNTQTEVLKTIRTEELEKNNKEIKDALESRDSLNFKKEELIIDVNDINDLQEKVDRAINLQSNEIRIKMDEISMNRKKLIEEIEEINLILSNKYKELDMLNTNIKQTENELETIKSNFHQELTKIENMRKECQDKEKKITSEGNKIENLIKKLNDNDVLLNNKQGILKRNQENFYKILEELTEENEKFSINYEKISGYVSKDKEISKNIDKIEAEKYALMSLIEKNKIEIENSEKLIRHYNSEIISNDLKMPNLEHEKKLLVMSKNFKQAGKVSNDLKALNELKAELISKIGIENQKIIEINNQIQFNEEKLSEIEKELNNLKTKVSKERNEYLSIFRDQLHNILHKKTLITDENDKISLESELSSVINRIESYEEMLRNQEKIEKIKIETNIREKTELKNEIINENSLNNNDKAIYVFNKKKMDEIILSEDEINILKLEIAQDIESIKEKTDSLIL